MSIACFLLVVVLVVASSRTFKTTVSLIREHFWREMYLRLGRELSARASLTNGKSFK